MSTNRVVKCAQTRNTLLFLAFAFLITSLIIFSSCKGLGGFNTQPKGQFYKCTDGREVTNLSACEIPNVTRNVTHPVTLNLSNQTNAAAQRNYSTLREKPKNTTEEEIANNTGGSLPDLNGWSVQEIVDGMSAYDNNLQAVAAGGITYDPKDPQQYWIGNNPLTRTYDPFWVARSPYAGGVREYATYHFRIWLSQTPKEFLRYIEGKQNDSKYKLLYPDLWPEWEAIRCSYVDSCRTIQAITCTRGDHTLWMWTHNTPGASYTSTTKYNMQAVDDDRKTLTAFEKFYCTPV